MPFDIKPWQAALKACADPESAAQRLQRLADGAAAERLAAFPAEARPILAAVLAGSRALSALLTQHPEWITLLGDLEGLRHPRRKPGLLREVATLIEPALRGGDFPPGIQGLHDLRLRELLRIAARDLGRLGALPEIVLEISNVADVFLEGILRLVWRQLTERFGSPWHRDADQAWQPTAFTVLGLGKLGGQELNYSSDVDLLFVYAEEGGTFRTAPAKKGDPKPVLTNHQFFKRLGEALIKEASERGVPAGALRIDMRLRPEGDSGPLARSLDSYENFYAEWGQTWERMMLLKARWVAGDESLAGEFLEVIQPFRFPRSISEGLFREMAEMKARIEREVVRAGEIERNVKLGRGGIREIEFIAQTLQVLHGGKNPFLQISQTLAALPKLAGYQHLEDSDAAALAESYVFLRDVEHRLQMDEHRQTHTLPEDPATLERLARQMGCRNAAAFRKVLRDHTTRVRAHYERVIGTAEEPRAAGREAPWSGDFDESASGWWIERLRSRGFRDPEKGVRLLREFVQGPGYVHVSRRTSTLGRELIPRLLELCPSPEDPPNRVRRGFVLSDPDRVLARLDTYVQAYGTRASLYELWTARPNVFEHMLKLFDRSEFLAEMAIRAPDVVDELESGGHLGRQKDAAQTLADLRHGWKDEDQRLWLRRYFQTEFMRLGLRDILGHVTPEAANVELSALAEACVQYAVEVIARRHRLKEAPFAVIGLGKLGGAELVYGSDLDVVFVAPDRAKNVARLQKLAGEVIDLLSARTETGSVFVIDARLRPDGEKGLLVNVLRSYEDYYRQRAMLWEIQALTRARAVAGDRETGAAFEALARRLTNFLEPSLPLAAHTPDWKSQIGRMRIRIEKERTPAGQDALAFKTGIGGLTDVDFLAQALAMAGGWFEANTLRSLEEARRRGHLSDEGATRLIANFRQLRRMESILRRWSFEGEAVLPADPAAQYRVAIRCGYPSAETFLADLRRWRAEVRAVYRTYFP